MRARRQKMAKGARESKRGREGERMDEKLAREKIEKEDKMCPPNANTRAIVNDLRINFPPNAFKCVLTNSKVQFVRFIRRIPSHLCHSCLRSFRAQKLY